MTNLRLLMFQWMCQLQSSPDAVAVSHMLFDAPLFALLDVTDRLLITCHLQALLCKSSCSPFCCVLSSFSVAPTSFRVGPALTAASE